MTPRKVCRTDAERILFIQEQIFGENWLYNSLDTYIDNDSFPVFCAEYNKEVAGYISANKSFDQAEITSIAVLPEYRNLKIASSLMEHFENQMRQSGVKEIFLEVRTKNFPAVSLYEKFGYEKVGIRKNYYKDDDAYVMKKEL